ncbi:MAG: hypothetical protein M0Q21_06160 [Ignavibacteriaceae bacterium]|nr:hypothetical protein [Ignavibacteriaceae bacterium]
MNFQQHKAILDIGSNSFHFVIYQIEKDKSFSVIYRKRIIYRLALQKQNGKSFLSEKDFTQAERIILELIEISNSFLCMITATATSAVREATNAHDFLMHIKKTTGISIEILSGEREAYLIYKAILYSEAKVLSNNILCLDIGGGSTEFILGSSGKILFVESLKLGAVRLSSRFFPNGALDQNKIDESRVFIRTEMLPVREKLISEKVDLVTGNSGTIHAMKALAWTNFAELNLINQDEKTLTREELNKSVELLLSKKTINERKTIPGIEPDRADILPAGAIILQTIFYELNLLGIYLSDYSLREGKLLEVLESDESQC